MSTSASKSQPVTPHDAASLVIVKKGGRSLRVLMGRRAPRHDFMPDIYVFPGGRVDAEDATAAVTSELHPEVEAPLAARWSQGVARALGVAALRETFEETGLIIGEHRGGGIAPSLHHLEYVARAITPADSPKRFHARFFLADAEHATGEVGGSGELLDLAWVDLEDAMRLPIIDVTGYVLREVERRIADTRTPKDRSLFIRYRNHKVLLGYE